jgi:hypothetical protein
VSLPLLRTVLRLQTSHQAVAMLCVLHSRARAQVILGTALGPYAYAQSH